jgi:hypothetical protein
LEYELILYATELYISKTSQQCQGNMLEGREVPRSPEGSLGYKNKGLVKKKVIGRGGPQGCKVF